MTGVQPEDAEICTADIYDAYPEQVRVCALQFRSFGMRATFSGAIETLYTLEDHTPVLAKVSEPGEERVLVVDGGASLRVGVMGDRLAAIAARNGWAGIVINGAIRDSAGMRALDIGVKALGATARRNWSPTEGQRGISLTFGDVTFKPGDWVYADRDSVLVTARRLDLTRVQAGGLAVE